MDWVVVALRQNRGLILDRPRPREGVAPNPLVGDWDGYSAPTASFRSAPGTLHIRQGYDGGLTAWLDRTFSRYDPRLQLAGIDQRNGEHLRVLSATQGAIVLATVNSIGVSYQYEGMLSWRWQEHSRRVAERRRNGRNS